MTFRSQMQQLCFISHTLLDGASVHESLWSHGLWGIIAPGFQAFTDVDLYLMHVSKFSKKLFQVPPKAEAMLVQHSVPSLSFHI